MKVTRRVGWLLGVLAGALVLLGFRSEVQAVLYGLGRHEKLVGKLAPELPAEARTLDGKPLSLASLRGRVVLLHFFSFACSNCRRIAPQLATLQRDYAKNGVQMVGIHTPETDEERDVNKLRGYVKEHGLGSGPVVVDPDYTIFDRYGIEAWPTVVVIDRDGTTKGSFVGDDKVPKIAALVDSLLGAASAN